MCPEIALTVPHLQRQRVDIVRQETAECAVVVPIGEEG